MIVYLTFADQPSGVYRSQVEDFVNFISHGQNSRIKLIAFISIREFFPTRRRILSNVPDAWVIPMIPKLQNWLKNRFVLYVLLFLKRPRAIIARNVLAGNLALKCREKGLTASVVYDGRGAISAEWNEYDVVEHVALKKQIWALEERVVLKSDRQIAVSEKLILYWKRQFGFSATNAIVIPCTLDSTYEKLQLHSERQKSVKKLLGIKEDDVVLVYSGSTAGWQSWDLISKFLITQMELQSNISVLFLSKETPNVKALKQKFTERVACVFLEPEQVPEYLMFCDYGILIREETVTNEVASPVKFAEYLACGLKVIISDKIGDYSEMAIANGVGFLSNEFYSVLNPLDIEEKQKCRQFALQYFTKRQYLTFYKSILNFKDGQ